MSNIEVLDDASAVASKAAELLAADLMSAVAENGSATWVAAGGSTPTKAYEILAARPGTIPWSNTRIVIGDERCVPPDNEQSNWHNLNAELLALVPIPAANRLRPPAELGAEIAAQQYSLTLRTLDTTSEGVPRFDHVWLGMGEDGHTLSLFPGHPGLESGALVAPIHNSPKPPPDRITFTFATLQATKRCLILATGDGKREAVARAHIGDLSLPVARAALTVERAGGDVVWLLDRDAAASLPERV